MDKAKAAVSDFMHKAGHHDTTVHEKVAPAVVQEKVVKTRHEDVQKAVDREVHQDHYHTSIQPVKDREILPEQHQHNTAPVETREYHHGDAAAIKARLEEEARQFKSTRVEGGTQVTQSTEPTIAGEHVHHHVHETIQPVIQKETIQPSVVHTTIPVHEVHENEPKHHSATALPAVSMADFKKQGGTLAGREERYDGFEGEPRAVGSSLGGSPAIGGTTGMSGSTGTGLGHHGHTTAGPHSSDMGNRADPRVDSDMSRGGTTGTGIGHHGHSTAGSHSSDMGNRVDPRVDSDMSRSGTTGTGSGYGTTSYGTGNTGTTGTGYGNNSSTGGSSYDNSSAGHKKPSLLDRLNPMKDTDGDGKRGINE